MFFFVSKTTDLGKLKSLHSHYFNLMLVSALYSSLCSSNFAKIAALSHSHSVLVRRLYGSKTASPAVSRSCNRVEMNVHMKRQEDELLGGMGLTGPVPGSPT